MSLSGSQELASLSSKGDSPKKQISFHCPGEGSLCLLILFLISLPYRWAFDTTRTMLLMCGQSKRTQRTTFTRYGVARAKDWILQGGLMFLLQTEVPPPALFQIWASKWVDLQQLRMQLALLSFGRERQLSLLCTFFSFWGRETVSDLEILLGSEMLIIVSGNWTSVRCWKKIKHCNWWMYKHIY